MSTRVKGIVCPVWEENKNRMTRKQPPVRDRGSSVTAVGIQYVKEVTEEGTPSMCGGVLRGIKISERWK